MLLDHQELADMELEEWMRSKEGMIELQRQYEKGLLEPEEELTLITEGLIEPIKANTKPSKPSPKPINTAGN